MKVPEEHMLDEYARAVLAHVERAPPLSHGDHAAPAELGRVVALAVRPGKSAPRRAVSLAVAATGIGLEDDMYADALSPRQLLLAGAPAYRRHALAPDTLRENILLNVDTAGLASGMLLQVGASAIVRLTFHCEACGYLDARQPGIAREIGRERGVLARVVRGGTMREGDSVVRLAGSEAPWPDNWRDRVARILAQVPDGMVLEYRQLARLAGIQSVYCRALPALARKLGLADRAVAQQALPDLPRWTGDAIFDTGWRWPAPA